MQITPFRADDPVDFEDYFSVRTALHLPGITVKPTRERVRTTAGVSRPGVTRHEWLAREDGKVVGHLSVDLPQEANRHMALGFVGVVPWYRRAGRGRAMHDFLLDFAAAEGRTTVLSSARAPIEGGAEIDPAGVRFGEAMGYTVAQTTLLSRLDLDTVEPGAHEELEAKAAAHADGYTFVTWLEGPGHELPEEYVDDLAHLEYRLTADMPTGDMDVEPEPPNPELIRQRARQAAATGTPLVHAAARHEESGRLVAWTFISVSPIDTTRAAQAITVVDPDHRGHRLGLLVKLANLRRGTAEHPGLRLIDTNNAEDNAPMIAVNRALGYRPHSYELNLQHKA
ncbi:GNAT family N-acetyltransferase [Actinorhabdospora filicis]|uniref:GNAT family N-acetyltransferase n=1 Tax=Actinorhabdospora filicis TaxID=1785913 RepID=A0A9W6SJP1_9ACTN|nr:GNAT family N-acetyltransferase [Actinorhabdospora filicis]GLZ77042.1 GNAT family N-acetyltransferase [Actinorhabdospora filicis]